MSSNFVDTICMIKCYKFEVQKTGYWCNNFVIIEICIISKLNSVESQNKKIKMKFYTGGMNTPLRCGEIKVKYYCGENVYALSNKS